MPTSQNGWSANDRSVIAAYSLPGGKIALRKGDVSVVLLWCATQWHTTVEPLIWPGNWGYAERTVRGSSTTLSNHASGTAIDCNAPQHPLGTAPGANFTPAETHALRRILAFCEGAIRWGGDYAGRKDGMHLEVNTNAAGIRKIADKIRGGARPTIPVIPPHPTENSMAPTLTESQLMGPWETWAGGTGEKLSLVDLCRRNNVEVRQLHVNLAGVHQKLDAIAGRVAATPAPPTGPPVITDADVRRIAHAVLTELALRAGTP